jgi:hypothetical protein
MTGGALDDVPAGRFCGQSPESPEERRAHPDHPRIPSKHQQANRMNRFVAQEMVRFEKKVVLPWRIRERFDGLQQV